MNEVLQALASALDQAFINQVLDVRAVAFAHVAYAPGAFKTLKAEDPKVLVRALIETVARAGGPHLGWSCPYPTGQAAGC